jgi:pimeloyl-ACP methyl ester carboxylesterase
MEGGACASRGRRKRRPSRSKAEKRVFQRNHAIEITVVERLPSRLRKSSWQIAARCAFVVLCFQCCGCAHLATVKTRPVHLPRELRSEQSLQVAREHLIAAEGKPPLPALGDNLLAVGISHDVLAQRPEDDAARNFYNFAVARSVQNIERAQLQPWQAPASIPTEDGNIILTGPRPPDAEHDPARYDLFPTDGLKIGGTFFKQRPVARGIGAPLVAVERAENPQFRQQYKLRRVYAPVTAVIKSRGRRAELNFVDPFQAEYATLGNRRLPLAIDLSASTAMLLAKDRPQRHGLSRLLQPQKYADTAWLCQLQPFDRARTPVIFIHGLKSTPAIWAPMIDSLREDSWIRKHYQFWVYSYPTGYPYPYSAMLLRRDLEGIKRAFPGHKRIILIGHSMGGMICRLMVTDAGEKIWRDLFGTTPAKTRLAGETRHLLEEAIVFNYQSNVQRVIFIATPHRGSNMASHWIGRLGSSLVRTPRFFASVFTATKPLLTADPAARVLKRMPNSIDTLEPNDRFVRAVNKIPISPGIPYHSIIGDRGRGDTPHSSDGVVPYWSSHLAGAQSELIVNSNHDAQFDPAAIREVKRILKTSP